MTAESLVGIDDGQFTCVPTNFSVFSLPVPHFLSNEKVIIFDLSSERCRWNIEDGLSSIEVIKISCDLIASDSP